MKLAAALVLLTATPAMADIDQIKHNCDQPAVVSSVSEVESSVGVRAYMRSFNNYQRCIQSFIESQQNQALFHVEAMEAAAKEFKTYQDKVKAASCQLMSTVPGC